MIRFLPHILCCWLLLLAPAPGLQAQQYAVLLDMPLELKRIPIVQPQPSDSTTVLKMAYAESQIRNPEAWAPAQRNHRQVYRVDVIYTQYPVDTARWITRFGKLMPARLEALFELDPSLRDPNLKWNFIAQTRCRTDAQARQYFHGIVLYHRPRQAGEPDETPVPQPIADASASTGKEDGKTSNPSGHTSESDSDAEAARKAAEASQRQRQADSLAKAEAEKKKLPSLADLHVPDEMETSSEYMRVVRREMGVVRAILDGNQPLEDSSVYHIFERHPEWNDVLVVMDWTGSMYPYGAQLVRWHQQNLAKGVVKYLAVFNDGDDRRRGEFGQKTIGHTGGVYFLEPDNLDEIIALMETVMTNGDGGDLPENDLEAVLTSVKEYPSAGKVILLSDRTSRVRDMPLLGYLDRPIVVIPCGLTNEVHPDYLTMAWKTGGSVLTGDDELHFSQPGEVLRRNQVKLSRIRYELNPLTKQFEFSERRGMFNWPMR